MHLTEQSMAGDIETRVHQAEMLHLDVAQPSHQEPDARSQIAVTEKGCHYANWTSTW